MYFHTGVLAHSLSSILSEDEEEGKTNDLFWQTEDDDVFHEPENKLIAHRLPSPQRAVGDRTILNKRSPKQSCDSQTSSTSKAITSSPKIKGTFCLSPNKNIPWAINEKSLIVPISNEKLQFIRNPDKFKTEMCKAFKKGNCTFGEGCQFAHGVNELRPVKLHNKYKTVKCRNYESAGTCIHGNNCAFIHNVNDHKEKIHSLGMMHLSGLAEKEIKEWSARGITLKSV